MPNVCWYGLLTAISIVIFIYTLLKAKSRKVIALYTFLSGLIYLFEYVVLVIFKGYVYHPNILKNDYFDNILGAVVSDAFSVPMAGALIGALNLSWKWILFITGVFLLIENWFLYSNVYTHLWWNLVHTGLGLISCFFIAKKWYHLLQENLSRLVRFMTLYFTSILLQATVVFILVAFFNLYHYQIGWFENETRDHVAFATAYILFLSLILTTIAIFQFKWSWKILIVLLTFPLNWLLLKLNILQISDRWSLGYFLLVRLGVLIFLVVFDSYFLNTDEKALTNHAKNK